VRFDAVHGNCDLGALFPLQRLLRIRHSRAGGHPRRRMPLLSVSRRSNWLYTTLKVW
jgi:hypothetical protein